MSGICRLFFETGGLAGTTTMMKTNSKKRSHGQGIITGNMKEKVVQYLHIVSKHFNLNDIMC